MHKIRKAVFPIAGFGTRFLPATKAMPKELLSIVDKPLIQYAAEMPFGRLLDPKELAKAVTFLASDDSGMMTRSVIHFDQSVWGGYSFAPPTPDDALAL